MFPNNPKSLNPCFNGRYSQSGEKTYKAFDLSVLILVLMEDTLREIHYSSYSNDSYVLILVLMEDTLRANGGKQQDAFSNSLNPCFNGRYSQRC